MDESSRCAKRAAVTGWLVIVVVLRLAKDAYIAPIGYAILDWYRVGQLGCIWSSLVGICTSGLTQWSFVGGGCEAAKRGPLIRLADSEPVIHINKQHQHKERPLRRMFLCISRRRHCG